MGSLLNQDCIHICVDNIFHFVTFLSRFPATTLVSAATVLVKAAWREDPLELFGDSEVACLCKQVVFTGAQFADIVLDF